ncbi:MAG: hypothetical protein IBJ18_08550 [Phycisphaerales bacterium]|nr:hypothetical protein [Phycisphaerales bacterium]
MSDTAAWCVWGGAVLLIGSGVTAEGYLAWMFIRDWREGRAEQRARRARWRAGSTLPERSSRSVQFSAGTAIVAIGMTAAVAIAQSPASPPAAAPAAVTPAPETLATAPAAGLVETVGSAINVQLNLDFTNAYFYRGIRQQDKGLIVQPAARVTTRLVHDAELTLDGFIGTWSSFGPNAGTQSGGSGGLIEDWYESDLYAGFTLTHGKLSLTTSYTFLTSPSNAFQDVQELGFTLALDDSEWMKDWSLKPYVTLATETGSNGSDGPELSNGVYFELGIAPGFSFDVDQTTITLTFPASVGLSLSDYYQDAGGSDETFGFAQVGAKASIPLSQPGGVGRFGAWTLNAGVSVLFLGDHTKAFNGGVGTKVIGTIGLQWNF